MKEIKAFVRPNKVNEIIQRLKEGGVENITASLAEGTGKLQDENKFFPQKFSITDNQIAKLEMVVEDISVERIVAVISEYGQTSDPGDGIIYVSKVEEVFRVKAGDKVGF
jgi:nitrogen regulatory protein P-II 1